MQKPNGYDEVQVGGDYTPVELGGHYCIIKQVSETKSKDGKEMVVVLIDFCKPDKQDGYFSDRFASDDRQPKKWPYQGSVYIMTMDYNDPTKTNRSFKTFCTSVERSNGFQIQWGGNDWVNQFKGKKIGAVYGEEENEYDGRVSMRRVLRWFCSWEAVETAKVPQPKLLPQKSTVAQPKSVADNFMAIPEGANDLIPF